MAQVPVPGHTLHQASTGRESERSARRLTPEGVWSPRAGPAGWVGRTPLFMGPAGVAWRQLPPPAD